MKFGLKCGNRCENRVLPQFFVYEFDYVCCLMAGLLSCHLALYCAVRQKLMETDLYFYTAPSGKGGGRGAMKNARRTFIRAQRFLE